MAVTMSSLETKLVKSLATANTVRPHPPTPSPIKTMLNSGWIISDPD